MRDSELGVVVIGRNEGERLVRCLLSVRKEVASVVYVDSNSTDGSIETARELGVDVVSLDLSQPFTAARARNSGFHALTQFHPGLRFVQFIDGDCELHDQWLSSAKAFLADRPDVAVVCGRLRERFPQRSIYNLLCDMEWDTPVGEAKACGGIAAMRCDAFSGCGGFREDLIAGEEPELCVRLRASGWHIWRLDAEMALHDAAMTRFSQWWRRTMRGGHAYAEGAHLHGAPPERHWVRESRRALAWGIVLPGTALVATLLAGPFGLLPLLAYPMQMVRLALREQRPARERIARAVFLVLARLPEGFGVLRFHLHRLKRTPATLIEYK